MRRLSGRVERKRDRAGGEERWLRGAGIAPATARGAVAPGPLVIMCGVLIAESLTSGQAEALKTLQALCADRRKAGQEPVVTHAEVAEAMGRSVVGGAQLVKSLVRRDLVTAKRTGEGFVYCPAKRGR